MSFKTGKAMRNLVIVSEVDHERVEAEKKVLELGIKLGKANARIAVLERLLRSGLGLPDFARDALDPWKREVLKALPDLAQSPPKEDGR